MPRLSILKDSLQFFRNYSLTRLEQALFMMTQDDTLQQGEIVFHDLDLFYNFEVLVDGEVIAHLSHDCENIEKPWVVTVGESELYRALTYDEAKTWIESSYRYGILPKQTTDMYVISVSG